MLSFTNCQRNIYQNNDELLSHTCLNRYQQKSAKTKCCQGCRGKEYQYTVDGIVNWCSHYGKQFGKYYGKQYLKIVPPYDPAIPLLGVCVCVCVCIYIYIYVCVCVCVKTLISKLSVHSNTIIVRIQKQSKCPSVNVWIKKM